ncbi:MAG: hypothetical protein ACPGZU_01620 [Ketobacter sp.]|jgi:hypothetical protein|nr:hypothetical protein [Pseudomonadota bacterium]|tara:strand:+ start:496 stop:831 length:336 start_codon:yes stop_codon:yes gene_type:complete
MTKDELIDIVLSANVAVDIGDRTNLRLVSEKPGIYSAFGLIKELQIRIVSAKNAGIDVIGIEELFDALGRLEPDTRIHSYSLKSDTSTTLLYFRNVSSLVGIVILKKPAAA